VVERVVFIVSLCEQDLPRVEVAIVQPSFPIELLYRVLHQSVRLTFLQDRLLARFTLSPRLCFRLEATLSGLSNVAHIRLV